MTDRIPLDHLTSDALDALYEQLDALQAVARGYCPACGRGDAAPTADQWYEQRQRADQAEAKVADYENRLTWHTTCEACARILDSSIRETERRERAEAALARVRKVCDSVRAAGQGHNPAVDWVVMRVLEAIDARLVNQSAPVHCPCNGVHFPSPDSCRWCKCHRTGRTAPAPAATEATDTTKEQQ